MRTIGIWCEHNFQIYSAIPVINKYLDNKEKVILFTRKDNIIVVNELVTHDNFNIVEIDNYFYKPASLFKEFFEILFVSENFSFVYKNEFVKKETRKRRILRKLSFIKIPAKRINKIYTRLNHLFFKKRSINNFFQIDLLITFTKIHYAYLIPKKDIVPQICIMESWDHPMKFPYYLYPNYSLTWNLDLAKDTRKIQHLKNVRQIYPLKFRYIFENINKKQDELENNLVGTEYFDELKYLDDKNIVLYPTTTSSSGLMHDGEMELLAELVNIFEKSNYYLYIKPKPNAPKGDYDCFKERKNIIVGLYSKNSIGSDMLDNNYHIFRYLLLAKSSVVINAGTTFGLEAALLNKKILQLNLSNSYQGFGQFCKTYHLRKYVLNLEGVYNFNELSEKEFLSEIDKDDLRIFSSALKKWITNW